MRPHVCPWWGGYFIDNPLRRWLHNPRKILGPHVRPGMRVLDFGCGMGFTSIELARLVGGGGSVVAIDLQPQMLATLGKRAERAGVGQRIRTQVCTADSIAWDQPVDFALAFYSAHEVPDVPRLLSQIHRLLPERGRFLLIEPRGHVTPADFSAMLAAAEQVGFQLRDRPPVRWSHTALLEKTSSATSL